VTFYLELSPKAWRAKALRRELSSFSPRNLGYNFLAAFRFNSM